MKAIRILATLSVILVLVAACAPTTQPTVIPGNSNPAPGGSGDAAGTVFEGTATIELKNFAFAPEKVTVKVGTEVTWINMDNASHNVTADDGLFVSQQLGPNESFKFIFNQPGTFTYSCTTHPSMKATIIVVQ